MVENTGKTDSQSGGTFDEYAKYFDNGTNTGTCKVKK